MIQLRGLHEALRPHAEWLCNEWQRRGLPLQVTSVNRPLDQQRRLRANFELCVRLGRFPSDAELTPGMSCRYPANEPGDSAHNFGLAWDSWVPPEYMADWIAWRKWQGWRVADDKNDPIHAELPNWRAYLS